MLLVFMFFLPKISGHHPCSSCDTTATPHRAVPAQSSARTSRRSQGALHTQHWVTLGAAEVRGLWERWFLSLEMSEFSLLFLMSDLPSEALALAGKH